MRGRSFWLFSLSCLAIFSAVCATVQQPDFELLSNDPSNVGKRTTRKEQQPGVFREYPAWEYNNFPIPDDYNVPGEWVFARFMYRAVPTWRGRLANWTIDYPRSDRHLSAAVSTTGLGCTPLKWAIGTLLICKPPNCAIFYYAADFLCATIFTAAKNGPFSPKA